MKINYLALNLLVLIIVSVVIVGATSNTTTGNETNVTNDSFEVQEIDPVQLEVNDQNQTNVTTISSVSDVVALGFELNGTNASQEIVTQENTTLEENASGSETSLDQSNNSIESSASEEILSPNANETTELIAHNESVLTEQNKTILAKKAPTRITSVNKQLIIKRLDRLDTENLPAGVKTIDDCSEETVTEEIPIYNGSTLVYINAVQRTKKYCKAQSLEVKKKYNLPLDRYFCSPTEEQDSIVIICDSKSDGNGDGICQSGESCLKYVIDDQGITTLMKNSRHDFVAEDTTYFLDELAVEVIA